MIDPAEPVCVLLAAMPHFLDADAARAVVAGYAKLALPGSLSAYFLAGVGRVL